MALKRVGKHTVKFENPPKIIGAASIVGPKEGKGPLKDYFDIILDDDTFGKDSYEKAECAMMYTVVNEVIKKSGLRSDDIDYFLAGDLLNQTISANYAARDLEIPFFGLYGACSTMTESLSLGAMLMDGGFADHVIASTSSHFSTAERQYRYPLEYGSQRAESAQWTVTGSGAMLLGNEGDYPEVTYVTTGVVKDYGILDSANMGAAMAPAAIDTLNTHFKDTGRTPDYYDVILTGDLGNVGRKLTINLLKEYNYDISKVYNDCGSLIFIDDEQNTQSGGSGCGCSAVVYCGYLYKKMIKKEIKRALIISTGALMSTTSSFQGESIPGIAHAVSIEI